METNFKNMKQTIVRYAKKWLKSVSVFLLIVSVGFGTGLYTGLTKPWEKDIPVITTVDDIIVEDNYTLTISTIEQLIKPASDLITTKYIYKDADTYENYSKAFGKRIPLTTSKIVFTYRGAVSVGIDLSKVNYIIDNDNKSISITLPKLSIVANEIDDSSFEYPFESSSIFNPTEMSDFTELRQQLKDKHAKEIMNDTEFMNTATENTKNVLIDFLTVSSETKDYTVVFK